MPDQEELKKILAEYKLKLARDRLRPIRKKKRKQERQNRKKGRKR